LQSGSIHQPPTNSQRPASSPAFYAWVEENEPEMFSEIQERVAEGRWELVGGWWIEPDCNIPGGEAFIRQALYGQRYFLSRFGKQARVGYNPDSFGHNATLPQILKRSGSDFYIFMRPGPHENDSLNQIFWWESNDGSRILTYRIPFTYTVWGDRLDAHIQHCYDAIPENLDRTMCFYGVGNHGGGPTRDNIIRINTINIESDQPQLTFSTTESYFDELLTGDTIFPVIHNELQHHASGCYAAHSGVKRWNRLAENALISAEKWSAMAHWITGLKYPKDDLEKAWKLVLFNQFHDILAGTSIQSAYEDAQYTYGSAIATADRVRNAALQKIAWNITRPANDEGTPLVVFNPQAWCSSVPVEVELGWFEPASFRVVDTNGSTVASQYVKPHTSLVGSKRICFIADLPPLGYHTYSLISEHNSIKPSNTSSGKPVNELENHWYWLVLDVEKGVITSLYDKVNRCQVFNGSAARVIILADPSDTWSHGVFRYDNEIGEFSGSKITLLDHGEVKTTVRVSSSYGNSRLTQEFTIYDAIPRIDVQVSVDWHEHCKAVKLDFPMNIVDATATYEIPYGHQTRSLDGQEEPGQNWVDLSGTNPDTRKSYGVSLLNDGKYSFSMQGSDCRLTVLRSPIYAHHIPYEPEPDGVYTYIDQGIQHFKYALLPHVGNWKTAHTVRYAAELNQPAFVLKDTHHPWAELSQCESLLSASPQNIVISAVKLAEDSNDLIIRCIETHNKPTKGELKLYGHPDTIVVDFAPCEIKTLRIPEDHTL